MLIRFHFTNHRSLRQAQELSFVVSPQAARDRGVLLDGTPLVRVMSIHGANASGKSNVLDAVRFMVRAVLDSQRRWSPTGGTSARPFAFGEIEPSTYEIEFVTEDTRWIYGFEIDPERVRKEWLHQFGDTGRRRKMFTREDQVFSFGETLKGPNATISQLVRPNSLFLSAAIQNGHAMLQPVWQWFHRCKFASPDDLRSRQDFTTGSIVGADARREQVLEMLRAADFGVVGVEVTDPEDPPEETRKVIAALSEAMNRPPRSFMPKVIRFEHRMKGADGFLSFDDESHGTRAWYGLLGPMLHVLRTGSLLCFDELDHHLHPSLVEQVILAFEDGDVNRKNAQLLFTTQRTLDLRPSDARGGEALLDRDQIWFTEKDASGESRLYPLSAYKHRRRENAERAYLRGLFGAVPYADIRLGLQKALRWDEPVVEQNDED